MHRRFIQDDDAGARTGDRGSGRAVKMRLLITGEDEYRLHRELLGGAIRALRPRLEVTVSGFGELEGELERFEPQVVICSRFSPAEPGDGALAWVAFCLDPYRPTKVRVGGSRWDIRNASLEHLLSVIDKAERLARSEGRPQES